MDFDLINLYNTNFALNESLSNNSIFAILMLFFFKVGILVLDSDVRELIADQKGKLIQM